MKKALLLFAMFAVIGTAYTASASVANTAGIYCDNYKGGHKCDENCKKDCKKAKKKGCCSAKASAGKKGCCSKSGSSTAKKSSCGYKSRAKASATADDKSKKEEKK